MLHFRTAITCLLIIVIGPFSGSGRFSDPTPTPAALTAESVTFVGQDNHQILGLYYQAATTPAPTVVLLNSMYSWATWVPAWRDRGLNVLAINLLAYSGVAMSPGVAHEDVQDILAVIQQLGNRPDVMPHQVAIIGGSLMGGYALVSCAKTSDCQTAILLSPTDYKDDLYDPIAALGKRPVFIAASKAEGTITATAQDYADRAAGPHQLILYDGGVHAMGLLTVHPELVTVIGEWLTTYLLVENSF